MECLPDKDPKTKILGDSSSLHSMLPRDREYGVFSGDDPKILLSLHSMKGRGQTYGVKSERDP